MMKYLIPLSYVITSILWIIFSDALVDILIVNPSLRLVVNSGKGIGFVLITGFVLFLLLLRYSNNLQHTLQRLTEQEKGFRHLFTDNPQPVWIYHRETLRFLEVNQA